MDPRVKPAGDGRRGRAAAATPQLSLPGLTRQSISPPATVRASGVMDPRVKPAGDNKKAEGRARLYSNASSHVPRVAALEYSVARFSKKLVCSTPFRMASSQGSGFFAVR